MLQVYNACSECELCVDLLHARPACPIIIYHQGIKVDLQFFFCWLCQGIAVCGILPLKACFFHETVQIFLMWVYDQRES